MIKKFIITVDGVKHEVEVEEISSSRPAAAPAAPVASVAPEAALAPKAKAKVADASSSITAPLQGMISEVKVKAGQSVKTGEVVVVIEAMKMENEVVAPRDCTIEKVAVAKGDSVAAGDLIVSIK